jgi:hypothetical protein
MDDEVVAARMPRELVEALDAAAARDSRTRASAMRVAVAEWVARSEARASLARTLQGAS